VHDAHKRLCVFSALQSHLSFPMRNKKASAFLTRFFQNFPRQKVPRLRAFIVPVWAMECSANTHLSIRLAQQDSMHR
jgi:hypothetical protein